MQEKKLEKQKENAEKKKARVSLSASIDAMTDSHGLKRKFEDNPEGHTYEGILLSYPSIADILGDPAVNSFMSAIARQTAQVMSLIVYTDIRR